MNDLPASKTITVVLFLTLSFSFLATRLVPVFAASSSNIVATDSNQVVGVSSLGSPSLSSPNGQNLFEDSFGKFIAIYIDYAGRVSVTYANSSPLSTGSWASAVKSPGNTVYTYPAGILVNSASLRIVAANITGSGIASPGTIVDIPVTIQRGSGNNIIGVSFQTITILDSSRFAQFPTAILAHNGDVIAGWNWFNVTSIVKTARWNHLTGSWTGLSGIGSGPDSALLDTTSHSVMYPSMIERQDNFKLYVVGDYNDSGPSNISFNTAAFNGTAWAWDTQNLAYETGASHGIEDAASLAWDPVKSLVVVADRISGENKYSVFTLNNLDSKIHIDTPTFLASTLNHGSITVNATSGDYYLFFINAGTDKGTGNVAYSKSPSGSSNWNSPLTTIDSSTNNRGLSLRRTGGDPTIDLLYENEATVPATIRMARVSAGFLTPALVADFAVTPPTPNPGQPATLTAAISGGLTPYTYTWSFGDGSVGSGPSPTHTFLITGTYNVRLNVTDNTGTKATVQHGMVASSVSFQFAEAGDWDSNSHTTANWQSISTSGVNFTLALGDFLYNLPTTQQQQQSWCNSFKASTPGGNVEILIGNHETFEDNMTSGGGSINKFILYCPFTLGSYTGTYGFQYYFDYPAVAPLARFIMIDPAVWLGNTTGTRVMYGNGSPGQQWVAAQINNARAIGIPWIIVATHKDCFSAGVESCEAGDHFTNFLMNMGVDLVLQGHDHDYQRSKQLTCETAETYMPLCVTNNGSTGLYQRGAGTVFLITGTGGGLLDHINVTDGDYGYFASLNATTYGYAKISVSANSLQGQFIPTSGGSFKDAWAISSMNSAPVWLAGSSLKTSNVSGKSLTLSWTAALDVNQVSSYKLYANGTLLASVPGTTISANLTGLTPLSHYVFQVQAGNPTGLWTVNGPTANAFTRLKGDVNLDCKIDIIDLAFVAISFGARTGSPGYNSDADLNSDGVIDIIDIVSVASTFGQTC